MKTKNIFRMLLVAAALLMGANNVKAETITLWNEGSSGSITIAGSAFGDYTQGTLYVYTVSNEQLYIGTGETQQDGESLFYTSYNGGSHDSWIRNGEYYNSDNSRFEFTLTSEMVTKIKTNGNLHLENYSSNITRVEFIPSEGTSDPEEGTEYNHYLAFKTEYYCAANWDAGTHTLSWGPGYQTGFNEPTWTFMAAEGINGNLSSWKRLHLHVSDWNNANTQKLKIVFKKNDGSIPPTGPTREFEEEPDASGNIDISLENVDWGSCDITNIQDLTIYGYPNDDGSVASVKITDAYYVTATGPNTYAVTAAATTNGTVELSQTYQAANAESYYNFYVTPTSGYEIDNVWITNEAGTNVSDNVDLENGDPDEGGTVRYRFHMPTFNVVIHATFKVYEEDLPTLEVGENTVWDGNYDEWLNNFQNYIDLDPAMFKAANQQLPNATKTVRIYGQFNSGWALELKHQADSWSPLSVWVDKNNGTICGQANDGTVNIMGLVNNSGYIEFPLSEATLASIIRNDDVHFALQGKQIAIDKVVIFVTEPHSITYEIDRTNGVHGGFPEGNPSSATAGSTVTFEINAVDDGWIANVTATFGENETPLTVTPGNNGEYSFTMPDDDVTVTLSFTEIVIKTVTIGNRGACTFSSDVAVTIPSGVTAYYAKEVDGNMVELEPITSIIPAETGVVLLGEEGEYTLTGTTGGTAITGNLLKPVLDEDGYTCNSTSKYVLTWHDRLVFAQTGTGIHEALVSQGQAYLDLGSTNAGSRLRIKFNDESTGISTIKAENTNDGVIYNLRGQRVENPTKGLYIINGKKVVIK